MIPFGQCPVARRPWFLLLPLSLTLGPKAAAQIIPIRSVPLAQGDQFLIFPSANLGMGGVSIALADSLFDPFRNPAMGARVAAGRLFAAPAVYGISRETGGGRTLPLGLLGRAGPWFGGLSGAIQQVEYSGPMPSVGFPIGITRVQSTSILPNPVGLSDRSHGNSYLQASLGRVLTGSGLSVGGGVSWSRLRAVSGEDLLYPGSQGLTQSGHQLDLRLGMVKEWPGNRSLEALILHDRYSMTDDVGYLDLFWDAGTQQFVQVPRVEHELNRLTTTGLHAAYQMPLASAGWRIGWIATANFDRQPRIAPDEIVTLSRDEGRSSAYNLGVGFSKAEGQSTFGIDAIYEPIWSTTWAVASAPIVTALGNAIPEGGRTAENRFRFSNVVLRLGVSQDLPLSDMKKGVGLQLGLAVRSMHYRLVERDYLAGTSQPFRDSWVEWSPTWGLSLRFPQLELHYRGRIMNGTGRPSNFNVVFSDPLAATPTNILLPPGGTLGLAGVSTVTHQISLSLPLR
ncbi:MAG TPA: hypothetical protein VLB49_07110 [Gemmatimonadales bacterium]|nr:hypothetical protein [Gemmatimonadales bacterium]